MSVLSPRDLIQHPEPEDMLVDYMGLPLNRGQVLAILEKAKKHLKKSPRKIAEYSNEVIRERHPHMARQIHFEAEDFL